MAGCSFPLERDEVLLGRSQRCDIVLDAPSVSRYHLKLCREAEAHWRLVDLSSRNGTRVDGRQNFRGLLSNHAHIRLGSDLHLLFRCDNANPDNMLTLNDVELFASETREKLRVEDLTQWVRENRVGLLATLTEDELRRISEERLYEYAHRV